MPELKYAVSIEKPIPSIRSIAAALPTCRHSYEGTNLTDRMGMVGVAMIFPEFVPVSNDVQLLITHAHGIDHIYDEGPNYQRLEGGPSNLQYYLKTQEYFDAKFKEKSAIYSSTCGFLAQVETVEIAAHNGYYQTVAELQAYRELINAIYTRMVVSFGYMLVAPKQDVDHIGLEAAELDPDALASKYQDFRNGKNIDNIPYGARNYALYLWTMIVQQQFDTFSASHNQNKALPGYIEPNAYYADRAKAVGIKPTMIIGARLAIQALAQIKCLAVNTLPRYKQERASRRGQLERAGTGLLSEIQF